MNMKNIVILGAIAAAGYFIMQYIGGGKSFKALPLTPERVITHEIIGESGQLTQRAPTSAEVKEIWKADKIAVPIAPSVKKRYHKKTGKVISHVVIPAAKTFTRRTGGGALDKWKGGR